MMRGHAGGAICTGDAASRHQIDIALAVLRNAAYLVSIGVWRNQTDQLYVVRACSCIPFRFSCTHRTRNVGNQHCVNAGFMTLSEEMIKPRCVGEVDVDHEADRHIGMFGSVLLYNLQTFLRVRTIGKCTFGAEANHRTVGAGVGERNAEFKSVGTGFSQGLQNFETFFWCRIT